MITFLVASFAATDRLLLPLLLPVPPPNGVGAFVEIGGYADDDEVDDGAEDGAEVEDGVFAASDSSFTFVDEGVGLEPEKLNLIDSACCCFDAKLMPLNGFVFFCFC